MVVDPPSFSVFLADTVTGKITSYVPVSKLSWGMRLNGAGKLSATLPLRSRELAHLDVRVATAVVRQSLGVAYGDRILECGPIWSTDYNADAETLTLEAEGLWSILDRRKVLPGRVGSEPARDVVRISGQSLGSIGRELIRMTTQDSAVRRPDGRSAGSLNVVLPARTDGGNERTYEGFDLAWVGERLRELTAVENGPDMRLTPRFSGGLRTVVEWVYEAGTDTAPLLVQDGPAWIWDTAVEQSAVVKIGVSRDGRGMASRAWAPGAGQEEEMLLAWATDTTATDAGYPLLETDTAKKDVEDRGMLQASAAATLAEARTPWDQWTLTVRADSAPRLGDYSPGDWAVVNVGPGHPLILPDLYRVRILAVDGDSTAAVKLTVAPMQGVIQ